MRIVSILTRKSIADVTRRKGRSLLMILGIFIGVLGLTAVNIANDTFGQQFLSIVAPNDVPNATFNVTTPSPTTLSTLQRASNAETVEVRTQLQADWKLADGRMASIDLDAYQNWRPPSLNTFQLTSGRWPGYGEIVMASRDRFVQPVTPGDMVTVTLPGGRSAVLRVVGLAYTIEQTSAQAIGYMSADGLQQIAPATMGRQPSSGQGAPPTLFSTELLIKMHDPSFAAVQVTFTNLTQLLGAAHIPVFSSNHFSTTNQQDTRLAISGLLNILLVLASIALLLVCVMILNAVNTLLAEQMKIIGVMKALGGTRWQITRSYLLSIGLYALPATALGLGVGLILCSQVTNIVAEQSRLDLPPFHVAPWVILTSVAVGLLVPMLSALGPLWIGTGITVREATAAYGVNGGQHTKTRAWGGQMRWIPQTTWLGLRGIFRRPGRAILSLLALTLSSAVFLAVQVTNQSIAASVYHNENLYAYDMWVDLTQNSAVFQRLRSQIQALPNVAQTTQAAERTFVLTSGGELTIYGLPGAVQVYQPQLLAGHWLNGQEQDGLILNDVAAQRLHLQVSDEITFSLEVPRAQPVHWKIVGIVHELSGISGSASSTVRLGLAFTTLDNLHALAGLPADGRSSGLWIYTRDHSPQALRQLRSEVVALQEQAGVPVDLSTPALDQAAQFDPVVIVYALFDTVAILVALVALLSLSNTLAASVIERRAEIGILRSLGATGWRVGTVFWIEGLALAIIAWGAGSLLGPVGGAAILHQLSTFVEPFDTLIEPVVIPLTLLFIIIVSLVASFGPALRASRLRLSEILRYE